MSAKLCFICDKTSENCQANLAQIKSQYSGYPFQIFMRKFLRKFPTTRNVCDPCNNICEKCFKQVNEYDSLCVRAKRIEDELHKMLMKSDKSWQIRQQCSEVEIGSNRTVNDYSEIEIHESKVFEEPQIQEEEIEEQPDDIEQTAASDGTRHECIECGQRFRFNIDYLNHSRTHKTTNQTKNLKCALCLVVCENKTEFEAHCELHRGLSSLQCVQCKKKFSQKANLALHMQRHASSPNFCCEICGKVFFGYSSFKQHKMAHDDIRKEKCNICGMSFRQKQHLKRHLVSHTGEKSFSCSICGKTFGYQYNRDVHEKIHGEDGINAINIHKCTFCDSAFARRAKLKEHMEKNHGTIVPHTSIENQLDTNDLVAKSLGHSV